MNDRFLVQYSEADFNDYCDILDNAYDEMPFSVVYPINKYEDHLDEEDYLRAFKSLIDFFEISIQYSSGLMISLLNHNEVEYDDDIQKMAEMIVTKALSFGDWVNSIFLLLLEKCKVLIPGNEFVEQIDTVLFESRKGNILNGWSNRQDEEFKSIVYFRNEYLGHDSSLSNEIYKEAILKIESRVFKMLEALELLKEYTPFVIKEFVDVEPENKLYIANLLKGVSMSGTAKVRCDKLFDENSYYLYQGKIRNRANLDEEKILRISPLVIYHHSDEKKPEEQYSYIFQSVAAKNLKRMVFVSPHENAKRKETELFKDDFRALMKTIVESLQIGANYKVSISKSKSWEELKEYALVETNNFIGQQIRADKYVPELFIDRKALSGLYADYQESNSNAFVLLGSAGCGKTNQLCYWAEKIPEDEMVLTFYSKTFMQTTVEDKLKDVFNEPKKDALTILTDIHKAAEKKNKSVYIFFDALNECIDYKGGEQKGHGAVDLLREIDAMFIKKEFPRFKVVFSCRTYTWEELISNEDDLIKLSYYFTTEQNRGEGSSEISLKGFSEEELIEAFPGYARKYELQTTTEELKESRYSFVRLRLSDPLVLKMAAQNFSGKALPDHLHHFNSTSLFAEKIESIEKQKGGIARIDILEDFTERLWEKESDSISLRELSLAYDDSSHELNRFAKRIFINDVFEYSQPFMWLIDEGILRVEKNGTRKEVRFVYERFHEYMFARVFIDTEIGLLSNDRLPIPVEAYERELEKAGSYAVVMGALRNALIMDYDRTGHDPMTIIKLANSEVYEAQPLVADALFVLLNEDYKDVCKVVQQMLDYRREESQEKAELMEKLDLQIEEGKKGKKELDKVETEELVKQYNEIRKDLFPVIQTRMVAVYTIYEMYKSNLYAANLFEEEYHPDNFLWEAMADPIAEVRDNVSLYIYYISRFNTEIGKNILNHLSDKILDSSILGLVRGKNRKELQQNYFEPASRVGLLMVIEGLVERQDYDLAGMIVGTWKDIVRKFTLNHSLIKIVMPFFKFFLRRQATVQVEYVNNGIEYQHFWNTVPENPEKDEWSQADFAALVPYLASDVEGFDKYSDKLYKAIMTGDSFSYFLVERVMIVQGFHNWESIADPIRKIKDLSEDTPFLDYMQMSMLYVLFHILEKSDETPPEIEAIFAELTEEWSERCKGLFKAHNNDKANKGKPYKQYTLNWYAAAYCSKYGDGEEAEGDELPVPVFYKLIGKAFKAKDKELLYYCIENMAVLVSDFGYYKTSLQLFEYLLQQFTHESMIAEFDSIKLERDGYDEGLRSFISKMLGTVKSYYPREVEYFVNNKLKSSSFPNIDQFREEILNINQSHEGIGDLLTHKFGNFIIWSLLHDKGIRNFFIEAFRHGAEVNDYFGWFDKVVRLGFRQLFDVKL